MNKLLPIPGTRNGWIAGMILAILSLLLYYLILYEPLRNAYTDRHTPSAFNPVDTDGMFRHLYVYADIPNYASSVGSQPIYLKLLYKCDSQKDTKEEPLKNLRLSFLYPNSSLSSRLLLLPGMTSKEMFTNSAEIKVLEPCEQILVRMSFIPLVGNFDIEDMQLLVTSDGADPEIRTSTKTRRATNTLVGVVSMIILAQILLPPWSNGFIPLLAFFACYIFEGESKELSCSTITQIFLPAARLSLIISIWVFVSVLYQSISFFVIFPFVVFAGVSIWKKGKKKV